MPRSTPAILDVTNEPAVQPANGPQWWQSWLPLLVLPATVAWLIPADWPRWICMWSLAAAIYMACKWLSWRGAPDSGAPLWRNVAYLAAWPGMDAAAFLDDHLKPGRPTLAEWFFAVGKLLLGIGLLYGAARQVPVAHPCFVAWVGIIGMVLMLHFGLFHLLSCAWRHFGVEARPLMNWPIAAVSSSDFWSRRWNTAFHDLAHRFLFRPLAPRIGAAAALWAGFLASGLIHDLAISYPASGGYGGPTLYFLLQAAAILAERSPLGRQIGLGAGLRGWLFNMAVVMFPLPLLFHEPLLTRVIVPLMRAIGAIS